MWIGYKKRLLLLYYTANSYKKRSQWKGSQRVFCLSMQKTGTTSLGDFFVDMGYPVVRSDMAHMCGWNKFWFQGSFNKIFTDTVFKNHQVFEDAPFWAKDFYKILYQNFPKALFILFTRDSEKWFESLVAHGKGEVLGDKHFHSVNYDIKEAVNANFKIKEYQSHYEQFYKRRNQEIIDFFEWKKADFFYAELEDSEKWHKLADHLGIELPSDFEIHSNAKS